MILGRVLAQKAVRRDEPSDIAEPDLPRRTDRTPVVAAQVHIKPTDYNRHGGVGPHADEEKGCVLQREVVVHGQEDGEAGDGDADWANGIQEAVAGEV